MHGEYASGAGFAAFMISSGIKFISHGVRRLITEREKLEFESLPEFVREPRPTRESYTARTSPPPARASAEQVKPAPAPKPVQPPVRTEPRAVTSSILPAAPLSAPSASPDDEPIRDEVALPKSAELEALWPGINHEFFHAAPRKGPSFYLSLGFAAGVFVATTAIWGFGAISHMMANNNTTGKEIVLAQAPKPVGRTADGGAVMGGSTEGETIIPLVATYEVASGDTLAGIALKNYHRATPRLLDDICRANNMRNANVLSLGQKLNLPEYHPQSRQIATGANSVTQ